MNLGDLHPADLERLIAAAALELRSAGAAYARVAADETQGFDTERLGAAWQRLERAAREYARLSP